jgi:hypothetical protein
VLCSSGSSAFRSTDRADDCAEKVAAIRLNQAAKGQDLFLVLSDMVPGFNLVCTFPTWGTMAAPLPPNFHAAETCST